MWVVGVKVRYDKSDKKMFGLFLVKTDLEKYNTKHTNVTGCEEV